MNKILYLFLFIFFLPNKSISSNIANDLERLSDLYKNGMITKEKLDKSKSILLGKTKVKNFNKTSKTINKNTDYNFSKSNLNYKKIQKKI